MAKKKAPQKRKGKVAPRKTVQTKNVNKGVGGLRVDQAKYDAVKKAILAVVPRGGEGMLFKDLPKAVAGELPEAIGPTKGSMSWYTTVVKLDLEARGEIERIPGSRPQRLRRAR